MKKIIYFILLSLFIQQDAKAGCWDSFTSCFTGCCSSVENTTNSVTSNFLSNVVSVTSTDPVTGHQIIATTIDFPTTVITIPAFTIPIVNPASSQDTPYGSLALVQAANAAGVLQNQVTLTLDVTQLGSLPATQAARLPNGNPIPLTLTGGTIAQEIPVGSSGLEIYYAANTGLVLAGFALPINEFTGPGSAVPGVNLFPIGTFGNITASAGFYTGTSSSGIGVFVEVTNPGAASQLVSTTVKPSAVQMTTFTKATDSILATQRGVVHTPVTQ